MSPSFSYQRHTPGAVPFKETFSWQVPPSLSGVRTLSQQCAAVDGCRNLDDALLCAVQLGTASGWLEEQGRAYVQLGPNQLELLVHPDWRGQGWGEWLLGRILADSPPSPLEVWAYGDRPRVAAWLEGHGFRTHRILYSLKHQGGRPEKPDWPDGWRVATYRQEDLDAWHALHVRLQKDPGRAWSRARLLTQLEQPDTPADRFWLLWQEQDLRGYVWLKGDEIFLFALDPLCRGCGLGRRLLQFGLSHCETGWGYCDDTRPEALSLYRKLGFVEVGRDRCLRHCP